MLSNQNPAVSAQWAWREGYQNIVGIKIAVAIYFITHCFIYMKQMWCEATVCMKIKGELKPPKPVKTENLHRFHTCLFVAFYI